MKYFRIVLFVIFACSTALPLFAHGATTPSLLYMGWLPFWKKEDGTQDIARSMRKLHGVSPFSYEINGSTGAIVDKMKIAEAPWPEWLKEMRKRKVKIVPSIA